MNTRDIRGLDVGMLRTFSALMAERSVSRAAQRLFLSQPAVSATLSRLREAFSDPLFTRTGHGVVPTLKATALAPQVEQLLQDLAALMDDSQAFDPATSRRVFRIAGGDTPSQTVLPALSAALTACGSGIRILWEPPGTWSLPERLSKGELDLAMVARIHLPQDMASITLHQDHYVYAMAIDHPQAKAPLTLDLFCDIPQVFLGYGTSVLDDLIDETLRKTRHQRRAQIAVTSFGQILHLLTHSHLAAVLPNRVAQAHAAALCIRPLPIETPRYHSLLCWNSRSGRDPGVEWLKQTLLNIVNPEAHLTSLSES